MERSGTPWWLPISGMRTGTEVQGGPIVTTMCNTKSFGESTESESHRHMAWPHARLPSLFQGLTSAHPSNAVLAAHGGVCSSAVTGSPQSGVGSTLGVQPVRPAHSPLYRRGFVGEGWFLSLQHNCLPSSSSPPQLLLQVFPRQAGYPTPPSAYVCATGGCVQCGCGALWSFCHSWIQSDSRGPRHLCNSSCWATVNPKMFVGSRE